MVVVWKSAAYTVEACGVCDLQLFPQLAFELAPDDQRLETLQLSSTSRSEVCDAPSQQKKHIESYESSVLTFFISNHLGNDNWLEDWDLGRGIFGFL